jgi:hypothetical protein
MQTMPRGAFLGAPAVITLCMLLKHDCIPVRYFHAQANYNVWNVTGTHFLVIAYSYTAIQCKCFDTSNPEFCTAFPSQIAIDFVW